MKIQLSRFKNVGDVVTSKSFDRGNGTFGHETTTKFSFIYANLNESLSAKLSNLGTDQTTDKMIASMDTRFEPYIKAIGSDQIKIKGTTYNVSNVSKDDGDLDPLYEITISTKNNTKSNTSGGSDDDPYSDYGGDDY